MANTVTAHTHTHTGVKLSTVCPHPRAAAPPREPLTRVCGRDDGAEEEAVGVVELVSQLSGQLHQPDHAVHQVPKAKQGGVWSPTRQARHVGNSSEGETHPMMKQEMAVPRKA